MKRKFYLSIILVAAFTLMSCNDFLDQNPDDRATVDTESKVASLLVSAYPDKGYQLLAELSSDNVADYGITKGYTIFGEDVYTWAEDCASNNESPKSLWDACYIAIASANHALAAIEELGGTETPQLQTSKGEALLCRAYAHFILVNMFCLPYNPNRPNDLGIPYMDHPETELNPKYERGTVLETYKRIGEDIIEGIPLIDDTRLAVPKYHFNYKAACCFASRFFLFTQDWDNVIKYATMAIGTSPKSLLRDNSALAALPTNPMNTVSLSYCSADAKCNFLIQTGYSTMGTWFGSFTTAPRFTHGLLQATFETLNVTGPWSKDAVYWLKTWSFASGKQLLPRIPYIFEVTDPVGGKGYTRALFACLTAEEALLNRAEAYVMKMKVDGSALDKALADMNLYGESIIKSGYVQMTEETINDWANGFGYSEPFIGKVATKDNTLSPKNKLYPYYEIEAGTQENMIHALLFMRRREFIHCGMRWFDTRRMGITIHRLLVDEDAVTITQITDKISDEDGTVDPRRSLQLPADVIAAGLTPNPRSK